MDAATNMRERLQLGLNSIPFRRIERFDPRIKAALYQLWIQSGWPLDQFNYEMKAVWNNSIEGSDKIPQLAGEGKDLVYIDSTDVTLYHVTSLEGLYSILGAAQIEARTKTGATVGFSPARNIESGNWVYLGFSSDLPSLGKLPVQLVFSGRLLRDRNDYYLNHHWSYGRTKDSLPPNKLAEFLRTYNTNGSEVIFENPVPLVPYLQAVNIVQMPSHILELLPPDERIVVDKTRIPSNYLPLVSIIETLGGGKVISKTSL